MNKNIGIVIGVVVVALLAGGIYSSMGSKDMAVVDMKADMIINDSAPIQKNDAVPMKEEAEAVVTAKVEANAPTATKGSYEEYAPSKIAMAEKGSVVLFFHASWCPSCRSLNSNIEENLSSIPAGVSILKVNYDKEVELKKKYGVTSQHTLVQVDKDGNLIKKWSGGSKLTDLISKIQ